MANFESVLLMFSLTVDKSPQLSSAILENHFPLPVLVLQRAKRRTTSRKLAKSLTLDIKTVTQSKAVALKSNWNSTLKEALV